MKLIRRTQGRRVFALSGREKGLFERLLGFFPLRPEIPARLTREPQAAMEDADALLQSSLREARAELAGWLALRFAEGEVFQRSGNGWQMTVSEEDTERLLRVLNELRVGAWTKLGCPEDLDVEGLEKSAAGGPFFDIMILAGHFQTRLLDGLDAPPRERPPEGKPDDGGAPG